VIEVVGLTKRFGSTLAVDDLSFSVEPGRITGFLGPNGAGKSTTMRAILGLVRPTSGGTSVLGVQYRELQEPVRRVGVLLETFDAHPGRSGRNHLRVLAVAGGIPKSRVDEVLSLVDLGAAGRRRVKGYSLGMRQRLGLAAALLVPRRLVVLDEPTNGLDPAGTRDVRRVVAELRESGATVLLSSHLLAEVEAVCSHVAVLQTGTLLVAGELQTLLDADTGGLVVSTPDVDDAILALREAGAPSYRAEGGVAVPPGPLEAPEVVAALVAAGVAVWEVHRRRAHLEELFARLTEEDA